MAAKNGKNGKGANGKGFKKYRKPGNGNGKKKTTTKPGTDVQVFNDFNNYTFEKNHTEIVAFLQEHIRSENTFPTVTLICKKTGLSEMTVRKHLKQTSLESYKPKWSKLTDAILARLTARCLAEGVAKDVKLWFMLVHNFSERLYGEKGDRRDFRDFKDAFDKAKEHDGRIKVLNDFLLSQ